MARMVFSSICEIEKRSCKCRFIFLSSCFCLLNMGLFMYSFVSVGKMIFAAIFWAFSRSPCIWSFWLNNFKYSFAVIWGLPTLTITGSSVSDSSGSNSNLSCVLRLRVFFFWGLAFGSNSGSSNFFYAFFSIPFTWVSIFSRTFLSPSNFVFLAIVALRILFLFETREWSDSRYTPAGTEVT